MNWTKENIHLLRRFLSETQAQFAVRLGLRRRTTIAEWENGLKEPGSMALRLLDLTAASCSFDERTAARLRAKLKRDEDGG